MQAGWGTQAAILTTEEAAERPHDSSKGSLIDVWKVGSRLSFFGSVIAGFEGAGPQMPGRAFKVDTINDTHPRMVMATY